MAEPIRQALMKIAELIGPDNISQGGSKIDQLLKPPTVGLTDRDRQQIRVDIQTARSAFSG